MQAQDPQEVLEKLVHFEFKDFVDTDFEGRERVEEVPRQGYLLYNGHRKDFGFGAFRTSDSYTIEADVLNRIREEHPEFLSYIEETGGFLIGGRWCPVDQAGRVRH
ncbi:MAG: hypothetical protein K6T63_04745 [Alicyclobacillus herbarius]|uniref:hypothetical protein n=1 Tax=Alicyclobacillus herbarius TaxID=122960 RepID=UPI0003FCBAD6|nr:hypothetical protein [Alicyclobacillus herbarius]MCL6631923.1 hypothetical protein [Alicyclobacillus herbarius]